MKTSTFLFSLACWLASITFSLAHDDYKTLVQLQEIKSQNGLLEASITVKQSFFSNSFLSFNSRGYNGKNPGPTFRVSPGDRVLLTLVNHLEATGGDPEGHNTTNLHFHGMHVDPMDKGDNIHVLVKPGDSHTYDFLIPKDHPFGTYWYHSHHHGTMNRQLLDGMAGVFIVEDDKASIDPILANMPEHVMIMQGLCSLKCESEWDQLVPVEGGESEEGEGHGHGHSEEDGPPFMNVDLKHFGEFPSSSSPDTYITVNGQFSPVLDIVANQYTRIRIVQGMANSIGEIAIPGCQMYVIARDGIYKDAVQELDVVIIPSGSRADIVVKCPLGSFNIENINDRERDNIIGTKMRLKNQKFVTIRSQEDPTGKTPSTSETKPLQIALPPRPAFMSNIVPLDRETYDIKFTMYATKNGREATQGVNFKNYEKGYYNHTVFLGETEQWKIRSVLPHNCESRRHLRSSECPPEHIGHYAHPFHMHTNHFYILETSKEGNDPKGQRFQKGEWRDTVSFYDETLTIVFRPDTYPGEGLLHCHFSEHADDGMSQAFKICDRNSKDVCAVPRVLSTTQIPSVVAKKPKKKTAKKPAKKKVLANNGKVEKKNPPKKAKTVKAPQPKKIKTVKATPYPKKTA